LTNFSGYKISKFIKIRASVFKQHVVKRGDFRVWTALKLRSLVVKEPTCLQKFQGMSAVGRVQGETFALSTGSGSIRFLSLLTAFPKVSHKYI